MHGSPVNQPKTELVYTLDPDRIGNLKAMYEAPECPIIRDDLVDALLSAGVDNLQLFDAVVKDPTTGKEYRNYKAFNIVGVISATDFNGSTLMQTTDSKMIDVDFDSLSIDENKARPFKLFRLAESVNAIIVSDVVRDAIEKRAIPGMVFYDPNDWSG
jgi:hypothetical protein